MSVNYNKGIVRCPKCGLIHQRNAIICDCGTHLTGDNIKGDSNKINKKNRIEKRWNWLKQPIENENDALQVLSGVSRILYIFGFLAMILGIINIIYQKQIYTIIESPIYFLLGFF
jgi:hypothetical protein